MQAPRELGVCNSLCKNKWNKRIAMKEKIGKIAKHDEEHELVDMIMRALTSYSCEEEVEYVIT